MTSLKRTDRPLEQSARNSSAADHRLFPSKSLLNCRFLAVVIVHLCSCLSIYLTKSCRSSNLFAGSSFYRCKELKCRSCFSLIKVHLHVLTDCRSHTVRESISFNTGRPVRAVIIYIQILALLLTPEVKKCESCFCILAVFVYIPAVRFPDRKAHIFRIISGNRKYTNILFCFRMRGNHQRNHRS